MMDAELFPVSACGIDELADEHPTCPGSLSYRNSCATSALARFRIALGKSTTRRIVGTANVAVLREPAVFESTQMMDYYWIGDRNACGVS